MDFDEVPDFPLLCLSVSAIMDVKNELVTRNSDNELLRSWSGDPCLPISWPGLFCQLLNGSSIITKM